MSQYKILHTADWHLGKQLYKKNRKDEHDQFLAWLIKYIIDNKINLLIIAGDIFDTVNPAYQIQKKLYDFVYQMGLIKNFQTIIITGNHDSNKLFEIPKSFFKLHNCSIYPTFDPTNAALEHYIDFNHKKVGIKLLPYFRNYELINHLDLTNDNDKDIELFFHNFFTNWSQNNIATKILVSHHCFGHYNYTGSEHAIFLSGVEYFPLKWVQNEFDYVALGHIHKRQTLSKAPPIIYPGSPIPLRFSETNQKYLSEITIDTTFNLAQQYIEIPQFKKLIQLNTSLNSLNTDLRNMIEKYNKETIDCYLEVKIQLTQAQSGVIDTIRSMLVSTNIELISFLPIISSSETEKIHYQKIKDLSLTELFESYHQHKYSGHKAPDDIMESFKQLIEESKHENP
ncbi:MAG: exonuclease subunit SbcD [Halobacteriovoraceae bacterium]|jgi:DNA repair protein SbcD/Mre11|nr:exonuclease subunit SbcD [Halobacteriovoraceae bacterium]